MTAETPVDLAQYQAIKRRHTGSWSENDDDKRRFRLIRFSDIKLDIHRRYLVKGLIPRDGLIVFWGPPKCGKSFLCTDLALHIALGREYRAKDIWRLEWRNREFADRFCESVVDLIRSAHPGALDGGAGP